MRKLLSIALAIMLFASVLPVLPVAADGDATELSWGSHGRHNDGGTATQSGDILTLTKDGANAFSYVFWNDEMKADTSDQDYSITFSAMVTGGASCWNSYEFGFMRWGGDWGCYRFFALGGSDSTQVAYDGFGGSEIKTGMTPRMHNYSIVTNRAKETFSVYVDGTLLTSGALSMADEFKSNVPFCIRNTNSSADNRVLTMTVPKLYKGEKILSEPDDAYYFTGMMDFEDGTVGSEQGAWHSGGTFTVEELGSGKAARMYRPGYTTVQLDLPGSGTIKNQKAVYEFDLTVDKPDSEWKFKTDDTSYTAHTQWVLNRNGEVYIRGNKTDFTVAADTTYRFSWVIDCANDAQELYVDGVKIGEGDLNGDPSSVRTLKLENTLGSPYGAENISLYFDNICAYEYSLAQIQSNVPATPEPTEEPTPTPEPTADPNLIPANDCDASLRPGTYHVYTDGSAANAFNNDSNNNPPTVVQDAANNDVLKVERVGDDLRFWTWADAYASDLTGNGLTYQWEAYMVGQWPESDGWDASGIELYTRDKESSSTRNIMGFRTDGNDHSKVIVFTTNKWAPVATISANAWHTFAVNFSKTSADSTDLNYDILVDGQAVSEGNTISMANVTPHFFGFRTENWWKFQEKASGEKAYIDNVYLYETPAEETLTAPTVSMTAKSAYNSENAFYYVVNLTLNDATATAFTMKHYPANLTEEAADTQTFHLSGISGAAIKLISIIKDIPEAQATRDIISKATFTYSLGGNAGSVGAENTTSLSATR